MFLGNQWILPVSAQVKIYKETIIIKYHKSDNDFNQGRSRWKSPEETRKEGGLLIESSIASFIQQNCWKRPVLRPGNICMKSDIKVVDVVLIV